MAEALRHELALRERAAIDAEFARMAHDKEYQAEAKQICDDFADADWEALQLAENER